MHRLGDVVEVRLVEAAPVAGALRFELLSEAQEAPRGRKRTRDADRSHDVRRARGKVEAERKAKKPARKFAKAKFAKRSGKPIKSKGKSGKGKK
jgi:ribonuclease R